MRMISKVNVVFTQHVGNKSIPGSIRGVRTLVNTGHSYNFHRNIKMIHLKINPFPAVQVIKI